MALPRRYGTFSTVTVALLKAGVMRCGATKADHSARSRASSAAEACRLLRSPGGGAGAGAQPAQQTLWSGVGLGLGLGVGLGVGLGLGLRLGLGLGLTLTLTLPLTLTQTLTLALTRPVSCARLCSTRRGAAAGAAGAEEEAAAEEKPVAALAAGAAAAGAAEGGDPAEGAQVEAAAGAAAWAGARSSAAAGVRLRPSPPTTVAASAASASPPAATLPASDGAGAASAASAASGASPFCRCSERMRSVMEYGTAPWLLSSYRSSTLLTRTCVGGRGSEAWRRLLQAGGCRLLQAGVEWRGRAERRHLEAAEHSLCQLGLEGLLGLRLDGHRLPLARGERRLLLLEGALSLNCVHPHRLRLRAAYDEEVVQQ